MFKTSLRIILIKIILILCITSFNIVLCFAKINHKTDFTSGEFDYYVFAQSWYPTFCLSGPKNECKNLTKYMTQNFSPHGLWPNKGNVKKFSNHPSYCIKSIGCESYSSCSVNWYNIDVYTLREIQTMMPTNLIEHEWKKHGTCSIYDQEGYFKTILKLQKRYKTPNIIVKNIGSYLTYNDLLDALGGGEKINLACKIIEDKQYLEQIYYFLDKNFKEISKKYDQTNCNKNMKIFIKNIGLESDM